MQFFYKQSPSSYRKCAYTSLVECWKMTNLKYLLGITFLILLLTRVLHAVPLDTVTDASSSQTEQTTPMVVNIPAESSNSNGVNESAAVEQQNELETAATEQKPQIAEAATPTIGNYDPAASMYGYLTPEAIQQYVTQIGAAYPGYAAYPAPIGYAPAVPPPPSQQTPAMAPIYPGPYVVQTGYEGYLVPASSTDLTTNQQNNFLLRPINYITSLFSGMMMSAFFRIVAAIFAGIGMIFFGGAISRLLCSFTPICAFTTTAVEYLKSDKASAERVGRMLAEGMTPERVRRATELVQNAILKYQQLQALAGNED
ncbi:uncharacterized protein [Eurosta solidaginis]|uniref:uncharacterized protein n=1 Tax=Eurosta solidaginis TaxID=178769 RepID=UPI003531403D